MALVSKEMLDVAKSIADRLSEHDFEKAIIISHIDADGLTAASIASILLTRQDIKNEIKFVKQLDDAVIDELKLIHKKSSKPNQLIFWFTDLSNEDYGSC